MRVLEVKHFPMHFRFSRILIIVFLIVGAGMLGFMIDSQRQAYQTTYPTLPPTPTPPSFSPASVPDTTNWKIYLYENTADKVHYLIKYPPNLLTKEYLYRPNVIAFSSFVIYAPNGIQYLSIQVRTGTNYQHIDEPHGSNLVRLVGKVAELHKKDKFIPFEVEIPEALKNSPYTTLVMYPNTDDVVEINYYGSGKVEELFKQILSTLKFTD